MTKPLWTIAALLTALPASAAAAPPREAPAVRLDRGFLIGLWTDDGDCGNAIQFTRDGRFITANGGFGAWALDGDRLTMSGSSTTVVRIVPLGRDTIDVINPDGSLGRSTRCARRAGDQRRGGRDGPSASARDSASRAFAARRDRAM